MEKRFKRGSLENGDILVHEDGTEWMVNKTSDNKTRLVLVGDSSEYCYLFTQYDENLTSKFSGEGDLADVDYVKLKV